MAKCSFTFMVNVHHLFLFYFYYIVLSINSIYNALSDMINIFQKKFKYNPTTHKADSIVRIIIALIFCMPNFSTH